MKEKIFVALMVVFGLMLLGALGYLGYIAWVLAEIIGKLR